MFRGGSSDCMVRFFKMVGAVRQQNRDAVMGLRIGVDCRTCRYYDDSDITLMASRQRKSDRRDKLTIDSLQLTINNYGRISCRGTRTCDLKINEIS